MQKSISDCWGSGHPTQSESNKAIRCKEPLVEVRRPGPEACLIYLKTLYTTCRCHNKEKIRTEITHVQYNKGYVEW